MRLALIASILGTLAIGGCEAGVRTGPSYASPAEPAPVAQPGRVAATRWVTLADRTSADSNRQFINIEGRDAYRQIRIEANRGAPIIKQIAIEFADERGNPQVIRMDARLPAGEGQTIDLNGGRRPVQRIIVYTEPGGGSYSVFGV
jgi:hypothetical protein